MRINFPRTQFGPFMVHRHVSISIMMSHGKITTSFVSDMSDWRHMFTRVSEHEQSHSYHIRIQFLIIYHGVVNMMFVTKSIDRYLIRSEYVRAKRNALHRIINVIQLLGKLGLPYTGDKNEAAYFLSDLTTRHGNFLNLILFRSQLDELTEKHIKECVKKSAEQREINILKVCK